ncbi:MAG: hypothetical protein AAGG75_16520 [Bacteroidota bacterium]
MIKTKFLAISLSTMILRYYLMMMVVIAAGFTGYWWLAVLALPIFLSTILGFSISSNKQEATMKRMPRGKKVAKKAV